jgi:hypothetical protein
MKEITKQRINLLLGLIEDPIWILIKNVLISIVLWPALNIVGQYVNSYFKITYFKITYLETTSLLIVLNYAGTIIQHLTPKFFSK